MPSRLFEITFGQEYPDSYSVGALPEWLSGYCQMCRVEGRREIAGGRVPVGEDFQSVQPTPPDPLVGKYYPLLVPARQQRRCGEGDVSSIQPYSKPIAQCACTLVKLMYVHAQLRVQGKRRVIGTHNAEPLGT
jgi:hypothetical protein